VFACTVQIPLTTAAAAAMWNGWIIASGGAVTALTTPTSATPYVAMITGNIIASTGGVVQVQHASGGSGFGVTVKQGSWGIVNTLATVG
jgi:hypothetical protein